MADYATEWPDNRSETVAHVLLTHGASQPMTSPFFQTLVPFLTARGLAVTRFEFDYMRQIRETGKRRPPPKVESMFPELRDAARRLRADIEDSQKLLVAGKSMGGRIASMLADELIDEGTISGLVCLGYPFHPPKEPERLRTGHLAGLRCPALIAQGERDPFGTRADVAGYALAPAIQVFWVGDGDHDFGPRGRSGFTRKGNIAATADAIASFAKAL